jgi:hypothetical protein
MNIIEAVNYSFHVVNMMCERRVLFAAMNKAPEYEEGCGC